MIDIGAAISIVILSSFVFWIIGMIMSERSWKEMLVAKNVAQYNSKTGKWEWKDEYKDSE